MYESLLKIFNLTKKRIKIKSNVWSFDKIWRTRLVQEAFSTPHGLVQELFSTPHEWNNFSMEEFNFTLLLQAPFCQITAQLINTHTHQSIYTCIRNVLKIILFINFYGNQSRFSKKKKLCFFIGHAFSSTMYKNSSFHVKVCPKHGLLYIFLLPQQK